MILHEDYIIRLEYTPATDILQVEYPDVHEYSLSEVKQSLTVIVDAIRNYDVKRLLLDASKTIININDEENKELSLGLAANFIKTRLKKIARVQPLLDPMREIKAQENIKTIQQHMLLPYQIKTFTDKQEALKWLQAS